MAIIRKAAGAYSQTEIDDETVVMSLDSGDFYSLTGSARAIWHLLDIPKDRDTLVAELSSQFGRPGAEIAAEVDGFVEDLARAGLVKIG